MNKTLTTKSAAKTDFAAQLRVAEIALAKQTDEIVSIRKQIAAAQAQLKALKNSGELARKDRQIITLKSQIDTSLRLAGLRPSSVELEIDPAGDRQSPREAYAAAIESGDKEAAAEIFAAHKSELFRK
jgi:hypothetical protein